MYEWHVFETYFVALVIIAANFQIAGNILYSL